MKIAIDLNDVLRDYTDNFIKYYCERYNREYDIDELDSVWTNDLKLVFPFKTDRAYENFIYNEFAFELYGKCSVCSRDLDAKFNDWTEKTIKYIDTDEPIDVMFVSTMEYEHSIGATYFFLSKMSTRVREVYMPTDSLTIWDRCDVLITANPRLLENKPEGKIAIKIDRDYNITSEADYVYKSLSSFISDKNNTEMLLKK